MFKFCWGLVVHYVVISVASLRLVFVVVVVLFVRLLLVPCTVLSDRGAKFLDENSLHLDRLGGFFVAKLGPEELDLVGLCFLLRIGEVLPGLLDRSDVVFSGAPGQVPVLRRKAPNSS